MRDNVCRFRRLKWGDPEQKLKLLPETDAPRRGWLTFAGLLLLVFSATFGLAHLAVKHLG